jgi:glycosyltransferase involved in cell wall biosynthesis
MLTAIPGRKAIPHAGFADSDVPGLMQRAMRWVRGNILIPDARRGWVRHALRAAERIIVEEGIEAVLISTPPHSAQLIGLGLKRRWPNLRWVADLRDPWTDIFFVGELFQGRRAKRRNAAWEAQVIGQADAITVVGPSMKKTLAGQYGAAVDSKTTVITNGFDQEDLDRIDIAPSGRDRFRITYVGTMADSYAPEVLFQAAREAMTMDPALPLELRFVGGEFPKVKKMAEAAGLGSCCTWEGQVSHDAALREMASARILLLVIPQGGGEERILTGKLY